MMTEKEFERMLERARQKRADKIERFQAKSQQREELLSRAILTNRVRTDNIPRIPEDFDPRGHLEGSMQRALRRHAREIDLEELIAQEDEAGE